VSIGEHGRFEVWNALQHPLRHTLADFGYTSPSLPGVTNVQSALDWVLAVIYPQQKAAVANPAALPLLGNTINDYRVVTDDGDGKAAAYRWEQREGEVTASWHKIYDMDWGEGTVLSNFLLKTQDVYVYKHGIDDLDSTGAVIAGTYAGQTIYGGQSAGTNLTLRANSGDGVGASTGYVQVDDNFRPAVHNSFDVGTNVSRFKDAYFQGTITTASTVVAGTLTLSSGSINDSSGTIDFDNENLVTTGNITGAIGYFTSSIEVGPLVGNALILAPGSITDESGAISFGNENLSTTGTLAAGVTTLTDNAQTIVLDPDLAGVASITSSTGTISFGNENLTTTGNITGTNGTLTQLNVGNLQLAANQISATNANGDVTITSNANGNVVLFLPGTGIVEVGSTNLTVDANGLVTLTGQFNADNLRLDGNTLSSTNANGNIVLSPNGTGIVQTTASIQPNSDNTLALGALALRFTSLFLSTGISDGTNSITMATLLSLRDINVGVAAGMSIFYDGTKWVASAPDTEIDHGTISGLLDDDHPQYALLAGRAGGQTLYGGTAAGEHLVLDSTANASKGYIKFSSVPVPTTNASFAGSWSGTDIGGSSNYFRDVYTKGEFKGFRLENFTFATLPASSAQNIGRVVYATDNTKAYVDTGSALVVLGVSKYVQDTVWAAETVKTFTTTGISDVRNALVQFLDLSANNYETLYIKTERLNATDVRITSNIALTGTYRLIVME